MFENILVCIDDTGKSEAVVPVVAKLTKRLGSKLYLLNVIIRPTLFYHAGKPEIGPEKVTGISEREEQAADYLQQIATPLLKKGLDVECITVEGTVEESIVACAERYKVGLIALVRRERGSLGRLIFGSVSDYVLRKSGVPVMLINPDIASLHQ
jgi:nucleotide-binding universal stress UspA family protein